MKALTIQESINFERGKNPLDAMDIGLRKWTNLKTGDILKAKIDVGINAIGQFVTGSALVYFIPEGRIIHLIEPKIHPDLLNDYLNNNELESYFTILAYHFLKRNGYWIYAHLDQWKVRFNILQPGEY